MSHIQIRERREALGSPHRRDYERSMDRKLAQQGVMPKSLDALMAWYASAWHAEIPDALHSGDVWHDSVSGGESQNGVKPVGGSLIGTPSYNGAFRAYIENSHSQTDDDGYFVRPLHKALQQMEWGRYSLTASCLFQVAQWGFNWRAWSDSMNYPREVGEFYLHKALEVLWSRYTERSERAA